MTVAVELRFDGKVRRRPPPSGSAGGRATDLGER